MRRRPISFGVVLVGLVACGPPEPSTDRDGGAAGDQSAGAEVSSEGLLVDRTEGSGLDFIHDNGATPEKYLPEIMGSGGSVLDYDGDGLFDLYFVQSGPVPGVGVPEDRADGNTGNRLYRNLGGGRFIDVTDRALVGHRGYGMGSVAGDYDNDGDVDLYTVNYGSDVLFRNDGNGTFSDATGEARIDSPLWGSSASFFDPDRDGDLDLFVVNYLDFDLDKHVTCGRPSKGFVSYCNPDVYESAPDAFFRNNGDGTFSEVTVAAGLTETTGKGLGVAAADFTKDGWTDLYVTNDSTPNFLFRNLGDGTFEEAALWLGVGHNEEGKTEAGMGLSAGDVNGDGWLDVFVTNLSNETNSLYLGGEIFFTYGTRTAGLHAPSYLYVGFGNDLLDLDNDGDLDLLVTNGHVIDNIELIDDAQSFRQPTQVFLNDGSGVFSEVANGLIADLRVPRVGRGTMTLDLESDGALDVVVTYNNDRARLFRNAGSDSGSWIGFGFASGRAGERVELGVASESPVPTTRVAERLFGSSYETSSEPRLHFGLGRVTGRVDATVRSAVGRPRRFAGLEPGSYYVLP